MTRKHRLFALARWIFFGASALYLANFARRTLIGHDFRSLFTPTICAHTAIAACLFALTTAFSVIGWRALLAALQQPTRIRAAAAVFCYTQIGKYLPGNIGHHIGRTALAKTRLGISAGTSVISITQEAVLVSLSAVIVGLSCYSLPIVGNRLHLPIAVPPGLLLGVVVGMFILFVAMVNARRPRGLSTTNHVVRFAVHVTPTWGAIRATIPYYICLYFINGIAVLLIAATAMDTTAGTFITLSGAYSISWVVGFLLPGAPGGLGVRESAFTLLLADAYPPDVILMVILLARIATVCADFLVFLVGSFLMKWTPPVAFPNQPIS